LITSMLRARVQVLQCTLEATTLRFQVLFSSLLPFSLLRFLLSLFRPRRLQSHPPRKHAKCKVLARTRLQHQKKKKKKRRTFSINCELASNRNSLKVFCRPTLQATVASTN
jgi:hypothetical protein